MHTLNQSSFVTQKNSKKIRNIEDYKTVDRSFGKIQNGLKMFFFYVEKSDEIAKKRSEKLKRCNDDEMHLSTQKTHNTSNLNACYR